MVTLAPLAWPLIVSTGFVAGFVDSIAGGGGLITLPVLLAVGLPPHLAIGTNKVQSVMGSGAAAWRYSRNGLVPWRRIWSGVALSLLCSAVGAWAVSRVSPRFLEYVLPGVFAVLWLYVALKRDLGDRPRRGRVAAGAFYPVAGATLGFYDGFLGPGTGAFWTVAQTSLVGMDLKQATAATKPSNFASNLGALAFFLSTGTIVLPVGLAMAAGQIIGATVGSLLVIRHKPRFIRPFFLTVVALTIAKLVWDLTQ